MNLGELRRAPKPEHSCGLALHLEGIQERSNQMLAGAYCGSWDCEKCEAYFKRRWKRHLEDVLVCEGEVFMAEIEKDDLEAIRQRTHRLGKDFVRIETADGRFLLFNNAGIGEKLPSANVYYSISQAIDSATYNHRPIYTSRKWSFPEVESQEKKYKRVGRLAVGVTTAVKAVEQMGLCPEVKMAQSRESATYRVPKPWLDDGRYDAYCRDLASLKEPSQ